MLRFNSRNVDCISVGNCCIDWLARILFMLSSAVCRFSLCADFQKAYHACSIIGFNGSLLILSNASISRCWICAAAANGRDNLITIKFTNTGYCRRIWIEIEIIQCTSDQFQFSAIRVNHVFPNNAAKVLNNIHSAFSPSCIFSRSGSIRSVPEYGNHR